MILPIIAYGDNVLRKKSIKISSEYPKLAELIATMYETMHNAFGVGLAAPQIGLSIRMFIVDTSPFAEDDSLSEEEINELKEFKCTFINAKMLEELGEEWTFNEGCLNIPNIREDVLRKPEIKIEYFDEKFNIHVKEFLISMIKSKEIILFQDSFS